MWPFNKPQTKIRILNRDICKLRLSEWRSDPNLCAAAAKVLLDPTVRMMLDVLNNESPAAYSLSLGVDIETRAAYQSKTEGYVMALANLEAMAKHAKSPEEIQPTFEAEEKE